MDSRKIVLKETAIVAAGLMICAALMLAVYGLLGYFSMKVLLGSIVGVLVSLGNFFFMALTVSLAADKAQQQDPEGGKKMVKGGYPVRLLVIAVILFACAKSGYFDVLAMVLPLAFVRPTLTGAEFFRKKGV